MINNPDAAAGWDGITYLTKNKKNFLSVPGGKFSSLLHCLLKLTAIFRNRFEFQVFRNHQRFSKSSANPVEGFGNAVMVPGFQQPLVFDA